MRQAFVDNPPASYVSVDDIMEAQPHLQDLLNTQLPFMAKVVMRVQLSEESFDPIDGEREVIFSERRFATVLMLVRPLADPAERLRRYVVAGSRRTLEDRLEHDRFNNSQQKLEGIIDLQIFTSPSRELAQLPAAPGGAFEGGCWKELPELLKRGNKGLWSPKNGDHKCFRYCVMAHLLGCATWGRKYRQDAAECRGRPFYALPPYRPSKAQRALPPVDVQVDGRVIDFSMLPEDWRSMCTSGLPSLGLTKISSTSCQFARRPTGDAKVTVLLLLRDSHFVLIYNLDQLSSARSIRLPGSQQAEGHRSWNRCHRCMANFSRPETLKNHLARQVCSLEPGKRIAPALQMPDASRGEDRIHYKAGPWAALHPCVVYADFEVFNSPAPLPEPRILAKQHRVASFAYTAVGRSGFQIPSEHWMVLERATEESGEFGVLEYLLRSLLALAKVYKEWRMWTNKPCCVSPSEKRRHESAEACDICGELELQGRPPRTWNRSVAGLGVQLLQPRHQVAHGNPDLLPQRIRLRLQVHTPLPGSREGQLRPSEVGAWFLHFEARDGWRLFTIRILTGSGP